LKLNDCCQVLPDHRHHRREDTFSSHADACRTPPAASEPTRYSLDKTVGCPHWFRRTVAAVIDRAGGGRADGRDARAHVVGDHQPALPSSPTRGEPHYGRGPGDLGSSATVRGTLLSVVRAAVRRRRWWGYRRLHGSSGRGCPVLAAGPANSATR
jgi:hypothetical protein